MRCRPEATKSQRCAVGKQLAMQSRFAPMEQEIKASSPTPILLAVAAEIEHDTVLAKAKAEGLPDPQRRFIGDHTYFAMGVLGGCELFLVKCEAGAGGVSGAMATLIDAVRDVQPY